MRRPHDVESLRTDRITSTHYRQRSGGLLSDILSSNIADEMVLQLTINNTMLKEKTVRLNCLYGLGFSSSMPWVHHLYPTNTSAVSIGFPIYNRQTTLF